MTPIIPLLLKHALLAGVGAGLFFLLAFALRFAVRHDAVIRYRIMVATLLAVVATLPLQLLVAEVSASPRKPEIRAESRGKSALVQAASAHAAPTAASDPAHTQPAPQTPTATPPPATLLPTQPFQRVNIAPFAFLIYLLGVAVVFARHLRGALAARQLLARAQPIHDARVLDTWNSLTAGTHRPLRLLECEGLTAPACSPWGRAAILLPSPAASLDHDTLSISIRHELVHIARRDGLTAALAAVVQALLWFQPLAWLFVRSLGIDREQSCDATVVRSTGRAQTYARVLLQFCEARTAHVQPAPLIGFESAQSLTRRIRMLSHASQPTPRSRRTAIRTAAIASLAGALTAQGFFTASSDPGSLIPKTPTTQAVAQPNTCAPITAAPNAPSKIEVRAPADGRSELDVYNRAMEIQHKREEVATPGGRVRKHAAGNDQWGFFYLSDVPPVYPRGTWVTDEEPILTATAARVHDDTLRAAAVRVRLPGGSKLRAVFEGKSITVESDPNQKSRVLVTAGTIRIIDDAGIVRCEIRADREGATLTWAANKSGCADSFEITPTDAQSVAVKVDSRTGAPANEQQPPHGSTRWKLIAPLTANEETRVHMQWTYDISELKNPIGC